MCSGMTGMPTILLNNKSPICSFWFSGLVKLAQKYSEINEQYGFWKILNYQCVLLWVSNDVNLMSAKPGSQVVGKNVFGQSVCKVFLIFNMLKTIWKPMYFIISNT